MKLFLDTSVLLAACGSERGSSRALFEYARKQDWQLLASPWVAGEVERNPSKFPLAATDVWRRLQTQLTLVDNIVTLNQAVVFAASKDRPVLLTALAWSNVLLALDSGDFGSLLGGQFYGRSVMAPSEFPQSERNRGRLQ